MKVILGCRENAINWVVYIVDMLHFQLAICFNTIKTYNQQEA